MHTHKIHFMQQNHISMFTHDHSKNNIYQLLHNEPIQLQNFNIVQIDDPLEILSSGDI